MVGKLNLHIPVRGALYHDCLRINREIGTVARNAIAFAPPSLLRPHITVWMGEVRTEDEFELLVRQTADAAKSAQPFEFTCEPPRLVGENWVFRPVHPVLPFTISGWKLKTEWHVTVGYLPDPLKSVVDEFNARQPAMKGWADALEISQAGAHGTCVGALVTCEFNQ